MTLLTALTIALVFIAGIWIGWTARDIKAQLPDRTERQFLDGLGRVVGVKQ